MYLYCVGILSFLILFISESKVIQSLIGYIRSWLYDYGILRPSYGEPEGELTAETQLSGNEHGNYVP